MKAADSRMFSLALFILVLVCGEYWPFFPFVLFFKFVGETALEAKVLGFGSPFLSFISFILVERCVGGLIPLRGIVVLVAEFACDAG